MKEFASKLFADSLCLHLNIKGVLADEMGLGKTVQAIAFLASLNQPKDGVETSRLAVSIPPSRAWAKD